MVLKWSNQSTWLVRVPGFAKLKDMVVILNLAQRFGCLLRNLSAQPQRNFHMCYWAATASWLQALTTFSSFFWAGAKSQLPLLNLSNCLASDKCQVIRVAINHGSGRKWAVCNASEFWWTTGRLQTFNTAGKRNKIKILWTRSSFRLRKSVPFSFWNRSTSVSRNRDLSEHQNGTRSDRAGRLSSLWHSLPVALEHCPWKPSGMPTSQAQEVQHP